MHSLIVAGRPRPGGGIERSGSLSFAGRRRGLKHHGPDDVKPGHRGGGRALRGRKGDPNRCQRHRRHKWRC